MIKSLISNHQKFFTILFFAILLSVIYITISNYNTENNPVTNKISDNNYPVEGYGLMLMSKEMESFENFSISTKEHEYNVVFTNNTDSENTVMLLTYLDYKQSSFEAEFQGDYNDYHVFSVDPREEIVIPISFNKNEIDSSTILFLSVITGIDKHASELGDSSSYYSVSTRYSFASDEILADNDNNYRNSAQYIESFFSGVLLTPDAVNPDEIVLPPLEVNSSKGVPLDLSLRIGGHENTEDYIMWVIIDGKQVLLEIDEQRSPYLELSIPEGKHSIMRLFIDSPEERGKYDVMAFLVTNPWVKFDRESDMSFLVDTSYRFTLKLE